MQLRMRPAVSPLVGVALLAGRDWRRAGAASTAVSDLSGRGELRRRRRVVTDENGNFVTGLTRDDFEVFEDGKPQKIEMFSYVELPVEPSGSVRGPRTSRQHRHAIERAAVRRTRVRHRARRPRHQPAPHVHRQDVGARVRRAVISARTISRRSSIRAAAPTPRRTSPAIAICCSPPSTSSSGAAFSRPPSKPWSDTTIASSRRLNRQENEVDPSADITDTAAPISVLRSAARTAGACRARHAAKPRRVSRGRSRTPQSGAALQRGPGNAAQRDLQHAHRRPTSEAPFETRSRRPPRSNVNFFALDPRGLIGMTTEFIEIAGSGAPDVAVRSIRSHRTPQQGLLNDMKLSQDSLRTLAEETGGFAAVNQNMLGSAFGRIVDANSRYYVLGYYPPTTARDGRFHRIEVRAKRPGSARLGAPGICLAAWPHACRTQARRRNAPGARREARRREQYVCRSCAMRSMLRCSRAASPLPCRRRRSSDTQKEASVALAIEFDGERASVRAA